MSPPRPDPNCEWKKSKAKTEDLLALLNSGFIWEKEVDMWRAAAGDQYASNFFKGLMGYYDIEYLNLNPNGIFHSAVFVHFCEAFLGIKPHWILFRKFFRVKLQPSASNPLVVGGAGIQMREDAAKKYLSYKLIDSNQDWQAMWFYEPPSGVAEAKREAAQASPVVEHGADDAGGDPAPRVVGADQNAERSRAEGRARVLQLHEAQGAATDGSRHHRIRVHRRRRHVADS
jgi:hypothetical protein